MKLQNRFRLFQWRIKSGLRSDVSVFVTIPVLVVTPLERGLFLALVGRDFWSPPRSSRSEESGQVLPITHLFLFSFFCKKISDLPGGQIYDSKLEK